MVQVFCDLSRFTILPCRVCGLSDVMMWTDKDQMIGIVEESPDCLDLHPNRHLRGAERVEADDNDGIDVRNQRFVELRLDTIIAHPFDLDDRAACQCFGLLNESQEIRLLDVVEEATDPLIDKIAIRQSLEFRIE
jgi:hypothetical protein